MNKIPDRDLYSPIAYTARGIEQLLILAKETQSIPFYVISCVALKTLSLVVFPTLLTAGLILEPFFLAKACVCYYLGSEGADKDWEYSANKISKLAIGLVCTPLSLITTDAVSYLFLHRTLGENEVLPFGREITKIASAVKYPASKGDVQKIVKKANKRKQTISIIGTGMSQGSQTLPSNNSGVVINLQKLNKVKFVHGSHKKLIKVGAGATWEQVQLEANKQGKSIFVKQASNLFSVGGSIGINCHGWQHDSGALSSTIESLEVIDAKGNLRNVSMNSTTEEDRELFRCMFGTLGYFGVVVSATVRLTDNVMLEEKGVKSSLEGFANEYESNYKGVEDKPLLIGRLNLNNTPLQEVYFNTYEKVEGDTQPKVTPGLDFEPIRGQRMERIGLAAMGHLPQVLEDQLVDSFWNGEVEAMTNGHRKDTRNGILHFGAKSFFQLHQSDLYTQWLQEYFVTKETLASFLRQLGPILKENNVRLLNASIRPTPKDNISILPYAECDRYAIVISFSQMKTKEEVAKTEAWIKQVQNLLLANKNGDKWYQAYMPLATQEELEQCYGKETLDEMRRLKAKHDPENRFSNAHTAKYFDKTTEGVLV